MLYSKVLFNSLQIINSSGHTRGIFYIGLFLAIVVVCLSVLQ